jgi:pilus assembly protein CpaC
MTALRPRPIRIDLLGSINRIYGVPGRVEPARNYRGTYGFITD